METVTTDIVVHDPSAVSLLSSDGAVVLPASSTPATAPLAESRAEVGLGSSAAYRVTARRDADGSISTDWSTPLPLANGDRHVLLPTNGAITIRGKPLTLGAATTAIGLAFDLAMLPTLFASDRDVHLRR